jgi:alkaline phosphatase D
MLRVELDPNGAFNVTEYGSVRTASQFQALQAYSPFHRVRDHTAYPAVLFLTGEHDGRVNPAHSRKMTARVQAATSSRKPVLLRTSANTGHGVGTPLSARVQELVDVYSFLFDQLGVDYTLVDRGPWSGGITPTSASVKVKLAHPALKTRLVLSKNPLLTRRSYTDYTRTSTNHYDVLEFDLHRLEPDTQYYYAVEVDGHLERAHRGQFRTFPAGGQASFQFAFASCARTGSTSDVFDRIRENHPLFFLHMGDFQYLDIRTNSRARFRAAYDSVLASPQQSDLFRNVPLAYIWDDHDFGGNGSDGRSVTHEASRLTYEEFVPHYPFVFDQAGPISQSFTCGRVKFILTDLRSMRSAVSNVDDSSKSMMGSAQKDWFKKELLEANGKYPLICWVSSVPWIGLAGTNVYRGVGTNDYGYIHHTNLMARAATNNATSGSRTNNARGGGRGRGGGGGGRGGAGDEDHWSVFATERREIADFIKANHIQGVCILHGDSHMVAADDGSNSDYATGGGAPLPVLCGAPLDQDPSLKGGPYSQGVYRVRRGEGCFGFMTVKDLGDRIDVVYSGRNNKNEEKISLKFSVPAATAIAKKP